MTNASLERAQIRWLTSARNEHVDLMLPPKSQAVEQKFGRHGTFVGQQKDDGPAWRSPCECELIRDLRGCMHLAVIDRGRIHNEGAIRVVASTRIGLVSLIAMYWCENHHRTQLVSVAKRSIKSLP